MPYYGYGGQELEDPELDDLRRDAQAKGREVDPHTARQDELEARMERVEQQVADAEYRMGQRLEALERQLEGAIDRMQRDLDYRIYELERRMERNRG
jgi:hypothetical protein